MKMIKRVCIAASALLICIACSGCGNKDVFDTVYTFNKAICYGDFNGDGVAGGKLLNWTVGEIMKMAIQFKFRRKMEMFIFFIQQIVL